MSPTTDGNFQTTLDTTFSTDVTSPTTLGVTLTTSSDSTDDGCLGSDISRETCIVISVILLLLALLAIGFIVLAICFCKFSRKHQPQEDTLALDADRERAKNHYATSPGSQDSPAGYYNSDFVHGAAGTSAAPVQPPNANIDFNDNRGVYEGMYDELEAQRYGVGDFAVPAQPQARPPPPVAVSRPVAHVPIQQPQRPVHALSVVPAMLHAPVARLPRTPVQSPVRYTESARVGTATVLNHQDAIYEDTMVKEGVLLPRHQQAPVVSRPMPIYQQDLEDMPRQRRKAQPLHQEPAARHRNISDDDYLIPPADYEAPMIRNAIIRPTDPYTNETPDTGPGEVTYRHTKYVQSGENLQQTPTVPPSQKRSTPDLGDLGGRQHAPEQQVYQDIDDYANIPTSAIQTPPLTSPHVAEGRRRDSPVEMSAPWPEDMYADLPDSHSSSNNGRHFYGNAEVEPPPRSAPKPRELTEEEKRKAKLHEMIQKYSGQGHAPFSYVP